MKDALSSTAALTLAEETPFKTAFFNPADRRPGKQTTFGAFTKEKLVYHLRCYLLEDAGQRN